LYLRFYRSGALAHPRSRVVPVLIADRELEVQDGLNGTRTVASWSMWWPSSSAQTSTSNGSRLSFDPRRPALRH
jgi:hypothetical protein